MSTATQGTIAYDASAALVLVSQAQKALTNAEAYVIDSPAMYELAAADLQSVKALRKQVDDKRTGITGPLNQALKAVNDLFRPATSYLDDAEGKLKGALLAYDQEQARKAAEERRRAEEVARLERERIEREAREAQARAEAEAERIRQEAAAAAASGDESKANELTMQAQQTAAAGAAEAEQITSTVDLITAAPVPLASAAPKVKGLSTRENWKAQVTDKMKLLQHIVAHPEFENLVEINQSALNQLAKAQKQAMKLPGVEPFNDAILSARAA